MSQITSNVVKDFSDAIEARIAVINQGPTGLKALLMASTKPWHVETLKENDNFEIEQLNKVKDVIHETSQDASAIKKVNNEMYSYAIKAIDTLIESADNEIKILGLKEDDPLAVVFQEEKQILNNSKNAFVEAYSQK